METTCQSSSEIRSLRQTSGALYPTVEVEGPSHGDDSAFSFVDSSHLDPYLVQTPGKVEDVVFLYVEKGEVKVMLGLTTYILCRGMLVIKVPKVVLRLLAIGEDSQFKILRFTPRTATGAGMPATYINNLTLIGTNNPVLILDSETAHTVEVLLWLLQPKAASGQKTAWHHSLVQHVFNLFILEIASTVKRKLTGSPCQYSRKVRLTLQFLRMLREHIKEQRSVNFYANLLYVSPKHLSMCVKEITGRTCGEVIDEMVVEEAKALLHNPEFTIGCVADKLNFSDQYFFSKYFKKRTGMSPLHYRMAG